MDKPKDIPLGHVISSHQVLGWCWLCRGRTAVEEVSAWQVWAMNLPEVVKEVERLRRGAK